MNTTGMLLVVFFLGCPSVLVQEEKDIFQLRRAQSQSNKVNKAITYIKERGFLWTSLYLFRALGMVLINFLEEWIIRVEMSQFLTGDTTISGRRHTAEHNRRWNDANWSDFGENWTLDVQRYRGVDPVIWKNSIRERFILRYIKEHATVLEIGPGAGRWTAILLPLCGHLILADINERCLSICKERFKTAGDIEFLLIDPKKEPWIPQTCIGEESIDFIWSYDVFVHMNPTDIEKYIKDFERILRRGCYGVIHHVGKPSKYPEESTRSFMNGEFCAYLLNKHGLKLVEQDESLPHKPGDMISVFMKV